MASIIERIATHYGYTKKKPVQKRHFAAAQFNNHLASWSSHSASADSELHRSLSALRARSRDLANNNMYAKGFLSECKSNIVGSHGVSFQSKATEKNGDMDVFANKLIEQAWKRYSKKGHFEVTGQYSRADVERLIIESVARDGEVLIRVVGNYSNSDRFAIQLIEADHLDHELNKNIKNGNRIRMGVELNRWGKPVAYHMLITHPGESFTATTIKRHERVPANQIIHIKLPYRIGATRAIPWLHAAMVGLRDLGGYREAAIVAARVGASKMGFYVEDGAEEYVGDATEEDGTLISEAEPAHFEKLPAGVRLETWDPEYPHSNFDSFNKTILRGISTALGVQYFKLGNDLENVNFSSTRVGLLSERDMWMALQQWLIESFHEQIFPFWLETQIVRAHIKLPLQKLDKFLAPSWMGRRWQWVDPAKEVKSQVDSIQQNIKSVSETIRESGRDPDEVFDEIAKEKARFKALDIEPIPAQAGIVNSDDAKNKDDDNASTKPKQ